MTTACVIAAVCILLAGLFAVIVERTNERDEARDNAARLSRELEAAEWALAAERDVRRRTEARLATYLEQTTFASNVIPIQRTSEWPSWLEDALDEQAETWPTDGGAS